MAEAESLITVHRPKSFDEVVGQDAVVKSLKVVLESHTAHSFLFAGPSGVGKTTLSRIASNTLGASDCVEVDGAVFNGVDAMRGLLDQTRYKPFRSPVRSIIVDECQRISGAAWSTLLKASEEPADWLFWFFCTTDPARVPEAIKTRCVRYTLNTVSRDLLTNLLEQICQAEQILLPDDVIHLCVTEANGSPRQAISNLATCMTATNRQEAAELLVSVNVETAEAYQLARLLVAGAQWDQVKPILENLREQSAEGTRKVIADYITKVIMGTDEEEQVILLLQLLEPFAEPFSVYDGMTPVVRAVGRAVFSGN